MSKRSKKDSACDVSKMYQTLKSEIDTCKRFSDETIKTAFDTKETSKFYDVSVSSEDVDSYMLLSLALNIMLAYDKLSLRLITETQKNAVKRFCYESAHKFVTASVRVYREQTVDNDALLKAIDADEKAQKIADKRSEKRALLQAKADTAKAVLAAKSAKSESAKKVEIIESAK